MFRPHIVFAKQHPQLRVYKQALALRETGRYRLSLVAAVYDAALFAGVFDRVVLYSAPRPLDRLPGMARALRRVRAADAALLRHAVRSLDADLVHVHTEPNWFAREVVDVSAMPVVFDGYDFTTLRWHESLADPGEVRSEKYCFEHAAGVVHKGPEIDFMRSKYRLRGRILQFQDYCTRRHIPRDPLPKLSAADGRVHLVYAGVLRSRANAARTYGNAAFADIELVDRITCQQIHLHMYPSPFQMDDFSEYVARDAADPNFHFHAGGMPFARLHRELSQYDFGISFHRFELTNAQPVLARTTLGNKMFTYLEAGLPMLVGANMEYVAALVAQHGIGWSVNLDALDGLAAQLATADRAQLCAAVARARETLSMERQVPRLERFYSQLMGS